MVEAEWAEEPSAMVIVEDRIEQALQPLVGLPLSDMWRFTGWQRFEFGPQKPFGNRKGQETKKADHAVHVACDWRIVGPGGIFVGSDDYGPGAVRRDEHGRPFFRMLSETPPVVMGIKADALGGVHFTMTGGYSLGILPTRGGQEDRWIFLPPDGGSFALDGQGFGA